MEYIYFELKTTGNSPLFSRITGLDCLMCRDGNFSAKSFKPKSLHEEYVCLKEFSAILENADALACPDKHSVKYLSDCFKQYFIKNSIANKEIIVPEISPNISVDFSVYEGELKLFYKDYKNYYYFPMEDVAYHKSVAEFAGKSARIKATPQTAYIKKAGTFVPAPDFGSYNIFKKILIQRKAMCFYPMPIQV